ncbi:hypothetical protein GGI07_005752, partial [Coemansia sp. Benny D115]
FGVIVEFKLIALDKRENYGHHEELAAQALNQISSKNYDACLIGCLERLDVGMAIRNNVVEARSQLYRRETVDGAWIPVDMYAEDFVVR